MEGMEGQKEKTLLERARDAKIIVNDKYNIKLWAIVAVVILVLFVIYYLCPKGKLDGSIFSFLCRKKLPIQTTTFEVATLSPVQYTP